MVPGKRMTAGIRGAAGESLDGAVAAGMLASEHWLIDIEELSS